MWAFVATPLRAIADLVYARREITWPRDGLEFLTDSMRIEPTDLPAMLTDDADEVLSSLRNKRVAAYIRGLLQEIVR